MKQAKHFTAWLIDPFTLHIQGNHLVAARPKKRLLILKESDYHLINLEISPLRMFKPSEFAEIVSSEIAPKLDQEFKQGHDKCFDMRFGTPANERTVVVFGPYLETTENLHRVMTQYARGARVAEAQPPRSATLTIESLLGPQPTRLQGIQEKAHESEYTQEVVISTRLTIPMDGFSLE